MNAPVETHFTFEREEYVRAMRRHYKTALNVSRDVVVGIVVIAFGLYLIFIDSWGWMAWVLVALGIILLVMVAYGLFVLPNLIYNSQPKLKDEYFLSFSDDGIAFKTDGIDATLQWSMYHSWLRDDDFYMMYHGKRDLSVIPRRALTLGNDDKRLKVMLENHIGPGLI